MRLRHVPHALSVLVLVAATSTGCISTVDIDGKPMHQEAWEMAQRDVTRRAAFDLRCDEQNIEVRILDTDCSADFGAACRAVQVGTTGCDQRAVYVATPQQGWVLDAASQRAER